MFKSVLKNSHDADLRQKVVFYYKLLHQDIKIAEKIILDQEKVHTNFVDFYEDRQSDKRERLFLEFNSLSIVYGRPSETFLKDQVLKQS